MEEAVGTSEILMSTCKSTQPFKRNITFNYKSNFLWKNHCTSRDITKYCQPNYLSRSQIIYRWMMYNAKSQVLFHTISFQSQNSIPHLALFSSALETFSPRLILISARFLDFSFCWYSIAVRFCIYPWAHHSPSPELNIRSVSACLDWCLLSHFLCASAYVMCFRHSFNWGKRKWYGHYD